MGVFSFVCGFAHRDLSNYEKGILPFMYWGFMYFNHCPNRAAGFDMGAVCHGDVMGINAVFEKKG